MGSFRRSAAITFLGLFTWQEAVYAQLEIQQPLLTLEKESDCHNACIALANALDSKSYHEGSPAGFGDLYFSQQQAEVVPACVIVPSSAEEVSKAIKVIREHECIFAVKSGGHAMFAGASNAPGGITIDLRNLNGIELVEDGETTLVGTGNRWRDVYAKLEPLNRVVVGGRDSEVGVGGFILGGGISFISRRYGWALDNVRNFEVVLANGSISNINHKSHPDLYFALRGGGNNFGIITRFDLETYPQEEVWGGHNFFLFDDASARKKAMGFQDSFSWSLRGLTQRLGDLLYSTACRFGYCISSRTFMQSLENFIMASQSDPFASIYTSLAMYPPLNMYLGAACLAYDRPEVDPPAFKDFRNLRHVFSSNKLAKPKRLYYEVDLLNSFRGRQSWAGITFKYNSELMSEILNIFISETEPIKNVPGLTPILVIQPINQFNRDEISIFSKNGGNCLGLSPEDGPLVLFSVAHRWSNAEDDEAVQTATSNIISRTRALAKEMNVLHRFVYQNYANRSQDVYGAYGEENREKLLRIQRKYDPDGIFTRLQPGYFKL